MEPAQITEYFYHGIWRFDMGFGNPNKTATLLVQLALLSFIFIKHGQWGKWLSGIFFFSSVICLFHTFSRGGICALIAGIIILIGFNLHKIKDKHWKYYLLPIILLFVYCIALGAQERYMQGLFSEDKSITNRLSIWKEVPKMIIDAPYGWGLGEAGKSFMKWYQSPESNEQYRTLVNSHFTWLVEFGWIGRIFYIFLWMFAVTICLPCKHPRINPIPLSIVISFAVSSFFSSVAESPILWILPIICLIYVLFLRIKNKIPINKYALFGETIISITLILLLFSQQNSLIIKEKNYVKIGTLETKFPNIWILYDPSVFGDKLYTSSLKKTFMDNNIKNHISIGICESLDNIPQKTECKLLILSGNSLLNEEKNISSIKPERIILFSPQFNPSEISEFSYSKKNILTFIGEFSNSEYLILWQNSQNCTTISGIGDYIPDLGKILKDTLYSQKNIYFRKL